MCASQLNALLSVPGEMTSRPPILFTLLALAVIAACAGPSRPSDRDAQESFILESVLRYQLQEFGDEFAGQPDLAVCLGIGDGTVVADPAADLVQRLASTHSLLPHSACEAESLPSLVAGPIEWLQDDEVRVKGEYSRRGDARMPLVYRVVREASGWECLGPIVSWDPL